MTRRLLSPLSDNPAMKIGHCQLESRSGEFEANLAKFVKGLEWAERERVEIVCFPECYLTGYPDEEAAARKGAFAVDSPSLLAYVMLYVTMSLPCT